jgi:hypothetical protein
VNHCSATKRELDLTPTDEILKALMRRSAAVLVVFSRPGNVDDNGSNNPFSYHFDGEACCRAHLLHHLLCMCHSANAGLLCELNALMNEDIDPPDEKDLTE